MQIRPCCIHMTICVSLHLIIYNLSFFIPRNKQLQFCNTINGSPSNRNVFSMITELTNLNSTHQKPVSPNPVLLRHDKISIKNSQGFILINSLISHLPIPSSFVYHIFHMYAHGTRPAAQPYLGPRLCWHWKLIPFVSKKVCFPLIFFLSHTAIQSSFSPGIGCF